MIVYLTCHQNVVSNTHVKYNHFDLKHFSVCDLFKRFNIVVEIKIDCILKAEINDLKLL